MPIKKNTFKSGTKRFVDKVNRITPDLILKIIIKGMQYSNASTPIDTSTLINSQFREIYQKSDGRWQGVTGYAAKYALAVHGKPGTLKGKLRPDTKDRKNRGLYWGPDGHPQWLYKGFEVEGKAEIEAIIRKAYKVNNIK